MTTKTTKKRRGRPPAAQLSKPDLPFTMKLPDGRTLYVEVPGRWVTEDRDGSPALLPEAVRFLDRIQALALRLDRPPSPGFITSLREALGLTQAEFGERIGVDKMTVSRWERGTLRPSEESLAAISELRNRATRSGVTIPT
jgi:DNA-binding transcriptional regulator YiaG